MNSLESFYRISTSLNLTERNFKEINTVDFFQPYATEITSLHFGALNLMIFPTQNQAVLAGNVISIIKSNATVAQFDNQCIAHNGYNLSYGARLNDTALGIAALKGNILLIQHIIKIGEKYLFSICNNQGLTPLHLASLCKDKEKGYLAAKKLLQLGSPVNIVRLYYHKVKGLTPAFGALTPLDQALIADNIKIAAMLLRQGGVTLFQKDSTTDHSQTQKNLEIAMMTENEMLFMLGTSDQESNLHSLTNDLLNYIMSISVELDKIKLD